MAAAPGTPDGPVVGPPPELCIFPYRDPSLPTQQKHKIILMKRRVRLQQEALLRQRQHVKGKEGRGGGGGGGGEKNHQAPSSGASSSSSHPHEQPQKLLLSSPLTGFEVNWIMDDSNLERFLRAREWNVAKSFALLIETIKFRRESKPERLKPKEVSKANETGIMYRRGFDKFGHPILYVRPGKNPPQTGGDESSGERSIKLLVYMLERAVQSLKRQEGKSGITFIIDYNGYTNANQPPLGVALRFVDIFQNFYPERLASAFVIDTPWYFSTFWNCLAPFLPDRTVNKIRYISTKDVKSLAPLFEQVPAEYVESWIPGGKATGPYDHAVYWAAEAKQFETYMKFLQEEFIVKSQEQRMAEAKAFQEAQAAGKTAAQAMLEATRALQGKPGAGGSGTPASTVTRAGSAKSVEEAALLEKDEGEEDVQEEEEEEPSPELNEDEEKRRMLQEALRKEQEQAAAAAAKVDGRKGGEGGEHHSTKTSPTSVPGSS